MSKQRMNSGARIQQFHSILNTPAQTKLNMTFIYQTSAADTAKMI